MNRRTMHLLREFGLILGSFVLVFGLAGCPDPGALSSSAGDSGGSEGLDPTTGQPLEPLEDFVLEIEVAVEGQGTVERKAVGSYIELTAAAEDGWRFDGWSGTLESTANPVTILATESTSINARFMEGDGAGAGTTPETPLDRDGDGVADEGDACPGTSALEEIDTEGCAPSQLDTDGDTVSDAVDRCADTPSGETADEDGCAPSQLDSDTDGVADDADECSDTPPGSAVLPSGCALSQLDSDDDRVSDDVDQCPFTEPGEAVDATGCVIVIIIPVCGNALLEEGEQCDPPNGTTCDDTCRTIYEEPQNNGCADAVAAVEGLLPYSNLGSSTDGPAEVGTCEDFGSDIWFCYTPTCTGDATVSLCGSFYDTMMTVYPGCDCPTSGAIACDDDFCGGGAGSQVTFTAQAGASYLIRVGGWSGESGNGTMNISCGGGAVCGNGVVETGEQCDPPNGTTCDVACRFLTASVCGNGIVEPGEQCEPPNTAICSATCQTISGGQGATWTSTQYLFGGVEEGGVFTNPETYDLSAVGTLMAAHVTPDASTIAWQWDGDATILSTDVPLGVQTDIFRVDDFFATPGNTLTQGARIDAFALEINGTTAVWDFDYTITMVFQFPVGSATSSVRINGQQTGTASADATTIDWSSITGTFTVCDDISGCQDSPLDGMGFTLGTWTRSGG